MVEQARRFPSALVNAVRPKRTAHHGPMLDEEVGELVAPSAYSLFHKARFDVQYAED